MRIKEFLKKYGEEYFSFHKIDGKFNIEYINTEIGVSVKGKIKGHSMLDLAESGNSLVVEIEGITISSFEAN